MELLIQLGGIYCLSLVVFHLLFWRLFQWHEELPRLSRLNQAIMQVLNLSLTFVFVIFAYLSLFHTQALLTSDLGQALLALIALFWFVRAIQQIMFFKLQHWISWAFLAFFLLGTGIYGLPLLMVT